ncbi:MAG: NAD-dependent epimerase/dehydratase family protein [Opitutaceae bacterium]
MPEPTPSRLIVTGGRGRLASLVAAHFRAPAHAVKVFSREGGDGFQPLASLTEPGTLVEATAVLHLAWSTLPATSEKEPGTEEKHDLPLLQNILEAIAAVPRARRPHFIFFSSGGAVYGNAPGRANREADTCQPIGSYGRAKRAAEELIATYVNYHGLACTILRISNPYGYPVPENRVQGLIPHALRCAVENQPLTLWGDGSARKDFLHYTDFLCALELVLARRLTGTFNLSAGESHSVKEVIGLVEKHTGRAVPLQSQPGVTWDVQDSRLDNSRLIAATGWKVQVSLDEGIRRAAAGYPRR